MISPLLFIVYMDKITREANPNPEDLNEMLFADDQSLVHEKGGELQKHTDSLNKQCENFIMKSASEKKKQKKNNESQQNTWPPQHQHPQLLGPEHV